MILKYSICLLIGFGMVHSGSAQSISNQDSLTLLADSIHLTGDYKKAIIIRKEAIKEAIKEANNKSEDYIKYVKAKYYHTQSCIYEFESYNYAIPDQAISKIEQRKLLDSALTAAIKAREIYKNVKNPDKHFQYNLQNRIYHQTAFLGNWKHALEEAQKGLEILRGLL